MAVEAKVESRHDDGYPLTFRDDDGCLWRIAVDGGDGTLAVEEICEYGGGPAVPAVGKAETVGTTPCAVARWNAGGKETVTIYPCSHGENHTDPDTYGVNGPGEFVAGPNGWEEVIEVK